MTKSIRKEKIKKLLGTLFKKIKVRKEIYSPVIDGLIETSLRGVDSHGIRLAPHYLEATLLGRINPDPQFEFSQTRASTMKIDADNTYGITVSTIGMNKAVKMARKTGVGVVSIYNSSHFGAAGIYGQIAAENDMIGFSMTHVEDLVAPYGGTKPFFGTNAYCFTAPMADERPFILDMATSAISFNMLRMHQSKIKALKLGLAIDKHGKFTINPNEAVTLTPFGGYKGYGIQAQVEILCSMLTGMPFGPFITHMFPLTMEKRRLAHFLMAIDIEAFIDIKTFKKRMKEMAEIVRKMTPSEGFSEVRLAGDRSKREYIKRLKEGIPITKETIDDFQRVAPKIGLEINL
ncbi:Ldh family oxidoreductase [Candidatus Roizmanbacteria bacterium]|nr:Ldh family oxidoreductase [Candidatus Roizmanbacteria bacterium]